MTKDDVRAAAKRLVEFHEQFALTFGKDQAQDNAFTYIKGLMICPERKSIEPIALNVGNGNVSAMQKFINSGPWDHEEIQADLQHVFAKELVPTAAGSPIGVVGVVDEDTCPSRRRATRAQESPVNTTDAWARKTTARSGSFSRQSLPGERPCLRISCICPSNGASRPGRARTDGTRPMCPLESSSAPSHRLLRI